MPQTPHYYRAHRQNEFSLLVRIGIRQAIISYSITERKLSKIIMKDSF